MNVVINTFLFCAQNLTTKFVGVQHVFGDSGGFHHCAQRGSPGLALCSSHSASEKDGG